VRLAGTEQHAVRYDAGAAATGFQHPQEKREEKQFCLFGVGDGFQIVVDALCVHGALKRRVRKADRVSAANVVLLGNTVLIVDLRVRDGVEHQVHGRNAQHGAVRVKAGEHRAGKMLPLLRGHAVLVVGAEILRTGHQKACRAAGGVADKVVRRGLHQLHHHVADVLGRAELAVLPCGCQFAQHILVQVALHITVGNVVGVKIFQPGDDLLQHLRGGDQEHGIVHVPRKGGVALIRAGGVVLDLHQFAVRIKVRQTAILHLFDGREHPLLHGQENFAGVLILKAAPPHRLPCRAGREDVLHLLARHALELFGGKFLFIQRPDEHEIGQLLNDGQRIGDAACPDVRPDFVYLIFNGACYHAFLLNVCQSQTLCILDFW